MSELVYASTVEQPLAKPPWRDHLGQQFERLAPYFFISPFFIGFAVFQLFPIVFSLFLSTQQWNPYQPGIQAFQNVGLQHFVKLFQDPRFLNDLRVTLLITSTCTILGTAGAVVLAVLIDKVPDNLSNILRGAFFIPSVTSVVVIAHIWKQLLGNQYGAINALLTNIGLPRQNFLGEPNLAVWSIIVMLIWSGLGWDTMVITSALRAIPEEYYEAAKLDGANGKQEFFHITLPLLRPTLLFVVTTGLIFLLGIFAQVQLLTNGNPVHRTETIALYLYDQAFSKQEFGYASAIAVTLTAIMFVASFINFKLFGSDAEI
jgi:ABC-type sugar transport system permease subunit